MRGVFADMQKSRENQSGKRSPEEMIRRKKEKRLKVDPAHVAKIDKLIPTAKMMATKKMSEVGKVSEVRKGKLSVSYNHCFWSQYFHEAMNMLTREAGLRR